MLKNYAYDLLLRIVGGGGDVVLSPEDAAFFKAHAPRLLEIARAEHLVYPFLKAILGGPLAGSLSEARRQEFEEAYHRCLAQGIHCSERAARMLHEIDTWGLPVLLFKGPVVDDIIYGEGILRRRVDLDLLIHEQDWPVVYEKARVLGFEPDRLDHPLPGTRESRLFTKEAEEAPALHFHQHILNNFFLTSGDSFKADIGRVWAERAVYGNFQNIFCLRPEAQILFLCEHALKHDFHPLVVIFEIDRLLRQYALSFDGKKLARLAEECGLRRPLLFALLMVRRFFETEMPGDFSREIISLRLTALEKFFMRQLLAYRRCQYFSYAVYLADHRGFLNKILCFWRTAFPPGIPFATSLGRLKKLILSFLP